MVVLVLNCKSRSTWRESRGGGVLVLPTPILVTMTTQISHSTLNLGAAKKSSPVQLSCFYMYVVIFLFDSSCDFLVSCDLFVLDFPDGYLALS